MQREQELAEKVKSAVRGFAKSINSSSSVIADMSSLVAITSQLPLSNLEYWEKLIRREYASAINLRDKPNWRFWSKPTNRLTWIDLISHDGYKREKVLRSIAGGAPNAFFLALAFRRLNDWVPQVREAAREAIPQMAQASNPKSVVDVLCLTLANYNSWGRMEDQDKQVLLNIVSSKNIADALKSELISSSSPLTKIFAQIGRTSILDDHLGEIAKNAIQPTVRAKAYKSLLEGKVNWLVGRKWKWTDVRYCKGRLDPIHAERKLSVDCRLLETLKLASVDRSPFVRRVAAQMLIVQLGSLGDESFRLANHFASDTSISVAARGQYALKKLILNQS